MSWMLERRLSFLFKEFRRMKYFCAWLATCAQPARLVIDTYRMFSLHAFATCPLCFCTHP